MSSALNIQLKRTYRFRLLPNRVQEHALYQFAGARRWVWNWALASRVAHYTQHKTTLSSAALGIELTALKKLPDTAWLAQIDSQLLQQALRDLDSAYTHFFRRVKEKKSNKGKSHAKVGFPRFKARKVDTPRFRIPQRVTLSDKQLYVPKLGSIAVNQHRPVDGEIKSATIKRDPSGHWHVTLVAHFTMPDVAIPIPSGADTVGIDVGLKDFVVLSDGERVAAPKFYRRRERKLRRANKSLHRKQKGSTNRAKARVRLAKVHAKTAAKRQDFLHKLSTRIINKYSAICIEDLNVSGLVRTKLAKSIQDASWSEFRRMLEYKALWNRKHIVAISRWYPSSKLCGSCNLINGELTISDREWLCDCGVLHDRDLNASQNIKYEGIRQIVETKLAAGCAESLNACPQGGPSGPGPLVRLGATTKHGGMKQEAARL